jgi:hypothetical protein
MSNTPLSLADQRALWWAVRTLEGESLVARLGDLTGEPALSQALVLLCYKELIRRDIHSSSDIVKEAMSVVESKIQTVEDMYRLIWTAVANKQPISAVYKERFRLFCPHRLGRNREGKRRVLCYQYGGDSETGLAPVGSPENWRCVVFEKLRRVALLDGSWKSAPNHSRPTTCIVEADIDADDQPDRDPQNGQ